MLNSSSPARRLAGHAVVFSAIATALPLTASHAVQYVDVAVPVASPEPVAPATPATAPSVAPVVHAAVVPAAAVAAQQAPAAAPVARAQERSPDTYDNLTISGDVVTIDGKTKRWEELTPAEKARVRDAVAKANAALAKVHLDTDRIRRDLAQIPTKAQIDKIEGDLARTRAKAIEAERRMAGDARGPGRDADQIEAALAAALQSIDRAKLETSIRALAAVDPAKIAASVAGAQQSMEAAKAELARIQARIDADQHR